MLTGRRYVIAGLSRLTVRVSEALLEQNAEVVVLGDPDEHGMASEAAKLLVGRVRLVVPGLDRDAALEEAGLQGAEAFLALGEDDFDNLRFVADAHDLAPEVPSVLRSGQPEIADAVAPDLNIRRVYSVSALAAPSIVAAAVHEQVVETLRLGGEEVPLCVLDVHGSSPLAGETPDEIKANLKCAVIAVKRSGGAWEAAPSGALELADGDCALVGGRQLDVMDLAIDNEPKGARRYKRSRARHAVRRGARGVLHASLLRVSLTIFLVVLSVTFLVNIIARGLDLNDGIYAAVNASLGNTPPPTSNEGVQWFDLVATVAGFMLLWVVLSHLTALVLAERLEVRMNRRARRMKNHVVVVGLGRVGYRVVQLLADLKVPTVVVEESPNSEYLQAVAVHTPVLTGNGALAENLLRTGIDRARCIVACTNDDLSNFSACVHARRVNPGIRTVTRAFDTAVAARLGKAFQADVVLSSTDIATSAFIGAAVDALAMRSITLDGLELLAFRLTPRVPIEPSTVEVWRGKGLRVVVLQRDGRLEPPTLALTHAIETDDMAIVVGPVDVVRAFAAEFE